VSRLLQALPTLDHSWVVKTSRRIDFINLDFGDCSLCPYFPRRMSFRRLRQSNFIVGENIAVPDPIRVYFAYRPTPRRSTGHLRIRCRPIRIETAPSDLAGCLRLWKSDPEHETGIATFVRGSNTEGKCSQRARNAGWITDELYVGGIAVYSAQNVVWSRYILLVDRPSASILVNLKPSDPFEKCWWKGVKRQTSKAWLPSIYNTATLRLSYY